MTASARPPQVPEGAAWTVRHADDARGSCYQILDDRGVIVAALHYIGFHDPARNEANRALVEQRANEIATAVNAHAALVEALEGFLTRDGHEPGCGYFAGTKLACIASCAAARAALRLAGREP